MAFQVINALKIIKISFSKNLDFWLGSRAALHIVRVPPLLSRDPDIKPRLFRFLTMAREKNNQSIF